MGSVMLKADFQIDVSICEVEYFSEHGQFPANLNIHLPLTSEGEIWGVNSENFRAPFFLTCINFDHSIDK